MQYMTRFTYDLSLYLQFMLRCMIGLQVIHEFLLFVHLYIFFYFSETTIVNSSTYLLINLSHFSIILQQSTVTRIKWKDIFISSQLSWCMDWYRNGQQKKLNRHKLQINCQHKRGEQTATTLSSDAEKLFTLMRFGILSN